MDVSLYIHIPFCTRKCHYCHFYVLPDKELFKNQLMDSLFLEWERTIPLFKGRNIVSVYFGGGTPFLFGPERIKALLDEISPPSNAEITLEANPENVTREAMKAFADAGINRVSLGVQTLDAPLLTKLGRLHHPDSAVNAVYDTYNAGIENISVDLMYDLPSQTVQSWNSTLQAVTKLPIKHLSLYNLTIEPQTVFFKYRKELEKELPTDEASLEMLLMAETILEKAELSRYEISAFAKPGYYSRHNTGYWTGRPFIGMGPSAFSYWNGERFRNIAHLNRYSDFLKKGLSPVDFREALPSPDRERELVAIRIRLMQGIPISENIIDAETHKTIAQLCRETDPLVRVKDDHYQLTDKGKLFYDRVASEII